MENLAIIPARAGSKRLPNKNLRIFNGMPLIYWTIKSAIESCSLDRVVVSTDSLEIKKVALSFGAEVPELRPKRLSQDTSSTHDVILSMLSVLKKSENYVPDLIVTLQPTSPLRTSSDIDLAIKALTNFESADSLVTITALPNSLNPTKIMLLDSEGILHYNKVKTSELHSLHLGNKIFIRNGAAIYISKFSSVGTGLLSGKILGFEMPWNRSVDIDTLEDFEMAEAIMMYGCNTTPGS